MRAYYNEWDRYAAQWLRNLIKAGHIPDGDVDERSVVDVQPDDLRDYTQCHFFAGIGGWAFALRRAGWPDDRPVWTGSCPCQPFSLAGARKGFDDKRHLWPYFRRLIEQRKPPVLFGEQVAKAPEWLGLVRSDMETLEYAVGAIPIEAACAGADHLRDRYWFVADRNSARWLSDAGKSQDGTLSNLPGQRGHGSQDTTGPSGWLGSQDHDNADLDRTQDPLLSIHSDTWGPEWIEAEFRRSGFTAPVTVIGGHQYVRCADDKWRRLPPPRVRWMGNGIPARVARLRSFGNAIDPRPASQFIASWLDSEAALTPQP